MAFVIAAANSTGGIAQLLTVLFIFILVLVVTALTTRFVGGYQKMQGRNRNLEVIETVRIANNKYVQIIRTADKYIVVGVGKNEVSMLTEIDDVSLVLQNSGSGTEPISFADIINKAKNRLKPGGTDDTVSSGNTGFSDDGSNQ